MMVTTLYSFFKCLKLLSRLIFFKCFCIFLILNLSILIALKLIIVFCLILLKHSITLLYTLRIFRLYIYTTRNFPLRTNNLLLLCHLILQFILYSLIFSCFMLQFLPLILIIIIIIAILIVVIIANLISILASKLVLQIFPDRMYHISKSF